jgi:gliotoxin/aspirochlorine biosynthesis glutathione S-transferase
MEELSIKHKVHVIESTSKEEWFHEVNPHKMVPAMESAETRDGKRLNIWESTSCLTHLADAYDSHGLWKGADLWERTQVNNWLTLHTAGLG